MELTAELVVDGQVPSSPVVSPDGRWVVYVRTPVGQRGERPASQLWLAEVAGGERRLDVPEARITSPRWACDSESIFFLSDRQLHRIGRTGGGEAWTTWPGGLDAFRPLAGETIAIIGPGEQDDRRARLGLLDLNTGEIGTPAAFGDRHVADVVQRPGGGPLAVLTWSSPEIDPGLIEPAVHLLDPRTGVVTDLGTTPADAESPVWWRTAAGWQLAYLALTPPGLQAGTAVFTIEAGEHRNLTAGMPACPAELVQVDDGAPLVLVADGLDTAILRLDGLREVSRHTGLVHHLSANRDGTVVAAVVSTAHAPRDVHAGPPDELVRISDTRPELREIPWGTQYRLSYQASDGLALDGLLILPPGKARDDGPFPLVTLVHGGPYDRYADQFLLHWATSGQWFAHAGYAAFLPNPRGGQGHGHDFAARVAGAVGQEEWTDILTGIDLLVDEGVADPARLGIAGWSHGGFMAAWAIGQTDRFAAAIMGAGISDWGMLAATGEWGAFEAALGGSTGWEGPGPHRHDELSPISYASAVRTPVLILHGADDTNVPLSQAKYFHRALRHFGAEHELVVYPGENHSIRDREHQIDVLRRTRDWFDRLLRGSSS